MCNCFLKVFNILFKFLVWFLKLLRNSLLFISCHNQILIQPFFSPLPVVCASFSSPRFHLSHVQSHNKTILPILFDPRSHDFFFLFHLIPFFLIPWFFCTTSYNCTTVLDNFIKWTLISSVMHQPSKPRPPPQDLGGDWFEIANKT